MEIERLFKPIDSAIWEMSEVFQGLQDGDAWTRPHPRLLSVGELAAHVANGEARWLNPKLESPLVGEFANYYLTSVEHPVALALGAKALYAEVERVHAACKAHILDLKPELDAKHPERSDWTWAYTLEYTAFHIAYHTGQMYSVRHLLGHETADN